MAEGKRKTLLSGVIAGGVLVVGGLVAWGAGAFEKSSDGDRSAEEARPARFQKSTGAVDDCCAEDAMAGGGMCSVGAEGTIAATAGGAGGGGGCGDRTTGEKCMDACCAGKAAAAVQVVDAAESAQDRCCPDEEKAECGACEAQ